MLIMSEVRTSSAAFYAWGPQCNSLFTSFSVSLTCCHFICLFFLSFPLQPFVQPPPSHRPCGIEALRQQCKNRRDELLVYTLNLGWQGGQKKWSLKVPGGTCSPLPSWLLHGMDKSHQDLSPVLLSSITFYLKLHHPTKREIYNQRSSIH